MALARLTAAQIEDIKGIKVHTTLTGTNKEVLQSLADLILPEQMTAPNRGYLDQISPAARIQLIAELNAVYDAIENA